MTTSTPERVSKRKVAIITGTNSNLGLNIAFRLIEQVEPNINLTLIVTSRTLPRAQEVIDQIKHFVETNLERDDVLVNYDYLLIDFADMISILNGFYDVVKKYKAINYFFANAAQGTYKGIHWFKAIKQVCQEPLESVTTPNYRMQYVGVKSKDDMGLVFQTNVFGPYYFIQKLMPLLAAGNARIIWISSLMSNPEYLSMNDLQLIKSDISYEGSKRLIDLIHLGTYKQLREKGVYQYVVHPGIFTSKSMTKFLNVVSFYGMILLFYLARYLGSVWHTINGYKAAIAPLHAAMMSTEYEQDQRLKFGSATYRDGYEHVITEEIDSTGATDVAKYFQELVNEWDQKLKDQIVNTRKPI
ncbi:hypothetical protein TBLA_0D04010 [Henningerozyma blattae CBS 6284]|uniref:3beta-hydroxysteroid 3-dehydrogenase n=1 Tax=Henningerozyma blattae (strain ATCC 34711 / CBS 6284 / DSM 70876 / NBRC 10599 / NRRL Y-10934 / UCD 77-7) TaxID=1071380 RepID=I2H3E6_HENB6|nr:hypothetical protein TBLA_0D04010 [Tetrapisispora blattae CBS 6284]CCH60898.1 hypothetical protein TBLA_0D04010 [Tetrapisispora blattae CBS 6284]